MEHHWTESGVTEMTLPATLRHYHCQLVSQTRVGHVISSVTYPVSWEARSCFVTLWLPFDGGNEIGIKKSNFFHLNFACILSAKVIIITITLKRFKSF